MERCRLDLRAINQGRPVVVVSCTPLANAHAQGIREESAYILQDTTAKRVDEAIRGSGRGCAFYYERLTDDLHPSKKLPSEGPQQASGGQILLSNHNHRRWRNQVALWWFLMVLPIPNVCIKATWLSHSSTKHGNLTPREGQLGWSDYTSLTAFKEAVYNINSSGFSTTLLNSRIHSPPTAPSTTLWSKLAVMAI